MTTSAKPEGAHKTEATTLRKNFARYLAPEYLKNYVEIARLCDEELDQTGELLGYVREEAKLLVKSGTTP